MIAPTQQRQNARGQSGGIRRVDTGRPRHGAYGGAGPTGDASIEDFGGPRFHREIEWREVHREKPFCPRTLKLSEMTPVANRRRGT
jgi:hypothetical protein